MMTPGDVETNLTFSISKLSAVGDFLSIIGGDDNPFEISKDTLFGISVIVDEIKAVLVQIRDSNP